MVEQNHSGRASQLNPQLPVVSELLSAENNRHPGGKSGNSWSPACRLTKWEIKQRHEPGITGSDEHSLAESHAGKGFVSDPESRRPAPAQQTCNRHPVTGLGLMSACGSIAIIAGPTIATDGRVSSSSWGARGLEEEEVSTGEFPESRSTSAERVVRSRPSALISSFNISPCQKYSLSS